MDPESEVLIVGAGPTGLAMAVELRRAGLPCRLIDKASEPARHSQALAVQSRTLEQFERYGVADKLIARGVTAKDFKLVSDGKTLLTLGFDQIPSRYPYVLLAPQTATEAVLTECLHELGGQVERGVELVSCVNGLDCAHAKLCHKNGHVEEVTARWLVGCDGAHSKVREKLELEFVGDRAPLSFFLADVELQGPDAPTDELRVYLHDGNALFLGRWAEKIWRVVMVSREGADSQAGPTLADIQHGLDEFTGGRMTAVNPSWLAPFHISQRKVERYRTGNIFLAGDAAHVHSPIGGQGMNTGLQDAANLAWKMAAVHRHGDPDLLLSYDEERGAVGDALLRVTSEGLKAATTANPLLQSFRDLLLPHAAHLPAVQNTILGFISETGIHYRHSSAVRDLMDSGPLRGGDRVPNPDVYFRLRHRQLLLDSLKEGGHMALGINIKNEEATIHALDGVPHLFLAAQVGASARAGWIDTVLEDWYGTESQIILVRPDGYVGYRGAEENVEGLEEYGRLVGLPLARLAGAH
jgi:2-polyprenyl-6-methoxyphenol hydroxylase-like FAD-dependent oxidoreductase